MLQKRIFNTVLLLVLVVVSPPHVMLLLPGKIDQTAYSTDHHSGGPYVMWAGTPYEHIMMPVADGEHAE